VQVEGPSAGTTAIPHHPLRGYPARNDTLSGFRTSSHQHSVTVDLMGAVDGWTARARDAVGPGFGRRHQSGSHQSGSYQSGSHQS
jgi:hypothetical protein